MADRATKDQDVLKELLSGVHEDTTPDLEDLDKILYRDPKEAQNLAHRSFRLSDGAVPTPFQAVSGNLLGDEEEDDHRSFRLTTLSKKKSTVYFSRKMHSRLKYAKYQLRKLVPEEYRTAVSMSDIVNNALKIVLHEFETKNDKSILLKMTLKAIKK
ncbi:MAG: hypothetical protein D6E12_00380 [Desulfovibrio sp.]|nr:MAG: hypothetical protein D6E12_00380 [Desulfovibrio sp.]